MGPIFLYLILAIGVSFLCSILEAVLMSTPLSYVTMKVEQGSKGAKLFKKYKENNARPIAAILTLNTIANTVGAAGVGTTATAYFGEQYFGYISAAITVLILVFSEIIPKNIGSNYWKGLLPFTANTIRILIVVLFPFVIISEWITKLIRPSKYDSTISREEVSTMANLGEKEGSIEKTENKVIQNLIKLGSIKASDVMTPRVVSAIAPENMKLKEFYKKKSFLHHSRIPVYSDSPEYITGYVLRGQILEYLADDKFDVTLGDIKRDIACFSEDVSISTVWESMLELKEQIALIIDQYGTFQGIITLEDIIETIFGLEITDEKDEVADMQKLAKQRWEERLVKYKHITPLDDDDDEPGEPDDIIITQNAKIKKNFDKLQKEAEEQRQRKEGEKEESDDYSKSDS
ncbi:MAG: hemolysin family protein [Bacteroidales bacterium]|jgi:CBS domain containing-hemolysin-like protein|nr:hemolysin family protein [Bacteroidales bacterium]